MRGRWRLAVSWRDRAACIGKPIDWFFPHGKNAPAQKARALALCSKCPVSAECLADAQSSCDGGIRGGVSLTPKHSTDELEPKRCAMCMAAFMGSYRAKFCSDDCRNDARRESWVKAKQKARVA